MKAFDSDFSQRIRILALTAMLLLIWSVGVMAYMQRFIPPFERLELWLMPWKAELPAEASLDQRLSLMQDQLSASSRVAFYAFITMVSSFAAFIMYLSIVYQQKQRRARENMILVLKNQEIARRNEFIRYISATIGHEFKNNLGRIKRRIDLLPDIPQDSKERIDDNLDKLFADIDIFKKISDEREASLVEFQNVDLKALLRELAIQYNDLADISMDESATVPMIYAAPPLLKTVFENLFDNAVKYKKSDQPRARVLVSCAMDRDRGRRYVTVAVRDDGQGMDEQRADLCFYKGKGAGESWGQGLYFVKYIVGLHAGRIRIGKEYTAPGRGTEIIINLPFVEETPDV
ncbi:MAG: HAMP domain-containing histidine kinase [Nitrospirae bacterium]|nr:HAMP domain-containing histidine kinase [Nitrospirota bacterium]